MLLTILVSILIILAVVLAIILLTRPISINVSVVERAYEPEEQTSREKWAQDQWTRIKDRAMSNQPPVSRETKEKP